MELQYSRNLASPSPLGRLGSSRSRSSDTVAPFPRIRKGVPVYIPEHKKLWGSGVRPFRLLSTTCARKSAAVKSGNESCSEYKYVTGMVSDRSGGYGDTCGYDSLWFGHRGMVWVILIWTQRYGSLSFEHRTTVRLHEPPQFYSQERKTTISNYAVNANIRFPLPLTTELVDSLLLINADQVVKLNIGNAFGNLWEGSMDKLAFECQAGQFSNTEHAVWTHRSP